MNKVFSFDFKKIYLFIRAKQKLILAAIFILFLSFNALVFYQYVFLTVKIKPEFELKEIKVDQETIQKILGDLEKRQETLTRALATEYPEPFTDKEEIIIQEETEFED